MRHSVWFIWSDILEFSIKMIAYAAESSSTLASLFHSIAINYCTGIIESGI